MKTNCTIVSWLALPVLAITLTVTVSSSNLGATDFDSWHDGSWFNGLDTWLQPSSPGPGDDVLITKVVNFDSSTIGQSVTVSNLDLESGTLNVSGPAALGMAGTNSYWINSTLASSSPLVQHGGLTLAENNAIGWIENQGVVHQGSLPTLVINLNGHFDNEFEGTYDLQGDYPISIGGGGGGMAPYFSNAGLLRKSGGGGISAINVLFNNQNGTIEVDSGMLSLSGGGSSSSGVFTVAAGAVLDLTGGSSPTWAGLVTGSGAGQMQLSGGVVKIDTSLTLNLPDGLFQWTGGWLQGTVINSNVVTIAGANGVALAGGFYNSGLLRHTNTATLAIRSNGHFENLAGGTYDLEADGVVAFGGGGGMDPYFNNYGLLRKSSGLGTSTVGVSFYNLNGSIEVDSGQLSLNGQSYDQDTGSFIVTLGGTNTDQSGQLVCGGATLGGPLQVKLAGGFVPAPGNEFQIISCSSLVGAFSAIDVPAGISVSYNNDGVYLITKPKILNPVLSGGNLTFSFGTMSNQSYTVQRNDDLKTGNWVFYTNFTGNGSLMQVIAPATNAAHRFFRVREP